MKWLRLWCACLFLLALPEGYALGQDTNPVSASELIQRGRAELASNNWEAAVNWFRLASETEPTNSSAYALLGYSLAELDQHQEAVDAYETALAINPLKTNSWYYLGDSYRALGNYEKAGDAYQNYVSLDPRSDRAYYRLYYSLSQLKRYDEAEGACRQAMAIDPTNFVYCFELGHCQARQKHYADAVTSLQRALSLNPQDAEAYLWLGICQYHMKAYPDALTSLRQCVTLRPGDFEGYRWLADSLYMLRRYSEAAVTYQTALQVRPDDFNMNYWLGLSFSALGRYDEAADAFQRAAQIKPDDSTANDWRGMTLVRLGRFEEAAASFEKAYEAKKDDRRLRLELLLCYLASSQYEKAYRLYPAVLMVGGAASMLGYLVGLAILLRFSFKLSPHPFPGLGFSFAWLALFFEGQIAFISCLVLLSFLGISEGFLFGITLSAIPVIFVGIRAFARQPWGGPFAWPLRLGPGKIVWQSLLGMLLVMLLGSYCAEWIAHVMHRPAMVQEIIPLIKYALSANPLAAFATVVIVAPIAEEIIFRGLIYGAFEKRFRVTGAILVSSAVFALVHLQVAYFIPIFCLGIVLCWARWKTGSLGLPILLHVLNNGSALLLLKFLGKGV